MRHKYDFSPFFSFCHNNVIFLCNKVGLFVAFSCSTGLWYRTLILSFLIWVLFFALNDCFWKWLKNECANPGEARQTWRGAVRTLVRRGINPGEGCLPPLPKLGDKSVALKVAREPPRSSLLCTRLFIFCFSNPFSEWRPWNKEFGIRHSLNTTLLLDQKHKNNKKYNLFLIFRRYNHII